MARGHSRVPSVQIRQEHTESLLCRLTATSDEAERAELTERIVWLNLGLCDALANRYTERGAERDDLVQVARLALVLAVRRYQPQEGRPFLAFAVPTITGELKRHFRDHCWVVRPPRPVQELRTRARSQARELEQRIGHTPDQSELLAELGVDAEGLREALASDGSYRPWSLDAPVGGLNGEVESVGSTVADPHDTIEGLTDQLALRRLVRGLDERGRLIVKWTFEEGCSQRTIGERLGVSQMTVSRLLRHALDHLRDELAATERGDTPAAADRPRRETGRGRRRQASA